MLSKQYSHHTQGEQPNIDQSLLSQTVSDHSNLQNKMKSLPWIGKQKFRCSHYFVLIFSNIFYLIWEGASIFSFITALDDNQIFAAGIILIFFLILGGGVCMIFQKICLKIFLFDLLNKAEPKDKLMGKFTKIANSNTLVTYSLKTIHYEDENSWETYDRQMTIRLQAATSSYFADEELISLLEQRKLILVELQVCHQFDNPKDLATFNTLFEGYNRENKARQNGSTKIHQKYDLGEEADILSSYYYTDYQKIKLLKIYGYICAVIGLLIPFVIVARHCLIKRKTIKIVKSVRLLKRNDPQLFY